MVKSIELSAGRAFVIKPDHGEDLIEAVERAVEEVNVTAGVFWAIGAVRKATVSYYDQTEKKYVKLRIDKPLEILSCTGNVSELEGKRVVHAHVALADRDGKAYGGHLERGTEVFSGEIFLIETKGPPLTRGYDEITGLNVLQIQGEHVEKTQ